MIPSAAFSPAVGAACVAAAVSIVAAVLGLWVNGDRAERQRRRELHARSLEAVLSYGEMPFMIRRRRGEVDVRSAERVRLSDHFSAVQIEVSACQVLLAADGDRRVSDAYDTLVGVARSTAGTESRDAWKEPAITGDEEMNMGPLFARLADLRAEIFSFQRVLAYATLPRRRRAARWLGAIVNSSSEPA